MTGMIQAIPWRHKIFPGSSIPLTIIKNHHLMLCMTSYWGLHYQTSHSIAGTVGYGGALAWGGGGRSSGTSNGAGPVWAMCALRRSSDLALLLLFSSSSSRPWTL